jgi:hypothetical protein
MQGFLWEKHLYGWVNDGAKEIRGRGTTKVRCWD